MKVLFLIHLSSSTVLGSALGMDEQITLQISEWIAGTLDSKSVSILSFKDTIFM